MQYNGELKDGKMHGKGVLQFANGIVYEGPFVDGKREGLGRMLYPSGGDNKPTILIAEWKNDRMLNKGKLMFPDGEVFEGAMLDGKMHGKGTKKSTWA